MRRVAHGIGVLATLVLGACPGVAPSSVPPRSFWVSPRGDDADPGTRERPWATLHHAAQELGPGDRVEIRRGTYRIATPIVPRHAGTEEAWIEYVAHDGERVVIDASNVEVPPPGAAPPYAHDQGVFQLEGVAYVRVEGLTLRDAQQAGFTVRDSHHVALVGNTTQRTFASGIAVWDTDHDDRGTEEIEIRGNTVTRANDERMRPPWAPSGPEPPHEAISIGGAVGFAVVDNHVHHCGKEGIDVKETSKRGRVQGNHVHHVKRQGIYVDGWFGVLSDVEISGNHVHDCEGAGVVVSVEGGPGVEDVWIHDNLIEDNDGTGVLFGRWGDDGSRRRVVLERNRVLHNGHGRPKPGEAFHWITGGIFFYSDQLRDVEIRDNVVQDNEAFQIGASQRWLDGGLTLPNALRQRGIVVTGNEVEPAGGEPVHVGWPPDDYTWVHPVPGDG
jgi:Right handed beta helix region